MEKLESVPPHEYLNQAFLWWNDLSDSWKSFFLFNYLYQKEPNRLNDIIWYCKEIGVCTISSNNSAGTVYEGVVNEHSFLQYAKEKLSQIIFHSINAESLFDLSKDYEVKYQDKDIVYLITKFLSPETSNGLKGLTKLKTVHFYKRYSSKPPQLDVSDLIGLNILEEITLDITHCSHLQDILLLNLPKLKRIWFMAEEGAVHYYYTLAEEKIIESFKSKTRVEIAVSCY